MTKYPVLVLTNFTVIVTESVLWPTTDLPIKKIKINKCWKKSNNTGAIKNSVLQYTKRCSALSRYRHLIYLVTRKTLLLLGFYWLLFATWKVGVGCIFSGVRITHTHTQEAHANTHLHTSKGNNSSKYIHIYLNTNSATFSFCQTHTHAISFSPHTRTYTHSFFFFSFTHAHTNRHTLSMCQRELPYCGTRG